MPIRGSPNGVHHARPQPAVAIARNRWSRSIGTGGRNQSDHWSPSPGARTRWQVRSVFKERLDGSICF